MSHPFFWLAVQCVCFLCLCVFWCLTLLATCYESALLPQLLFLLMGFWECPRGATVVSKHYQVMSWSAMYTQKYTYSVNMCLNYILMNSFLTWNEVFKKDYVGGSDTTGAGDILSITWPSEMFFFLPSSHRLLTIRHSRFHLALNFSLSLHHCRGSGCRCPVSFSLLLLRNRLWNVSLDIWRMRGVAWKRETLNKWLCWERWGLTGGINGFVNARGSGRW